jgi:hypothetical protein
VKNVVVVLCRERRERVLPSGRMMIIISDATTKKQEGRGGGPGLLSVVNNWNDFPPLGKKRKKFYV